MVPGGELTGVWMVQQYAAELIQAAWRLHQLQVTTPPHSLQFAVHELHELLDRPLLVLA